jgi:hypothetical protein
VIERFLLPDGATATQTFVYQMGRRPLYCIENLRHGPGSLFLFVDERNQDHVDMIGHYDSYSQIVPGAVVMQARVHDYFASHAWQLPTLERAEGHEMRFVVSL